MLKKMDALIEWIANWILVITGIAVCVLIFSGAVMRYVLRTDFYGSEELILVAAFKAEMLEMFIKNPKILGIANIVKYVINLFMAIIASIWSIQYVTWNINMNVKSNVFRFPVVYAVLPIAISFIAWSIYCIRDLTNEINIFKKSQKTESTKGEE